MPAESIQPADDRSQPNPPKPASDKKKYIAVAVLLSFLLIAILTQPDENSAGEANSDDPPADPSNAGLANPEKTKPDAVQHDAIAQFTEVRELPRISVDDALQTPLFTGEPAPERKADTTAMKIQAVYGTGAAQSALVGESIVRPGQPLPDGRRVVKVTAEGVRLAP